MTDTMPCLKKLVSIVKLLLSNLSPPNYCSLRESLETPAFNTGNTHLSGGLRQCAAKSLRTFHGARPLLLPRKSSLIHYVLTFQISSSLRLISEHAWAFRPRGEGFTAWAVGVRGSVHLTGHQIDVPRPSQKIMQCPSCARTKNILNPKLLYP